MSLAWYSYLAWCHCSSVKLSNSETCTKVGLLSLLLVLSGVLSSGPISRRMNSVVSCLLFAAYKSAIKYFLCWFASSFPCALLFEWSDCWSADHLCVAPAEVLITYACLKLFTVIFLIGCYNCLIIHCLVCILIWILFCPSLWLLWL
jgi:hypothetical protein